MEIKHKCSHTQFKALGLNAEMLSVVSGEEASKGYSHWLCPGALQNKPQILFWCFFFFKVNIFFRLLLVIFYFFWLPFGPFSFSLPPYPSLPSSLLPLAHHWSSCSFVEQCQSLNLNFRLGRVFTMCRFNHFTCGCPRGLGCLLAWVSVSRMIAKEPLVESLLSPFSLGPWTTTGLYYFHLSDSEIATQPPNVQLSEGVDWPNPSWPSPQY